MLDFINLAESCAADIPLPAIYAIVKTESNFNPFAIGIVGGRLSRQPQNINEATATAYALKERGINYSVGLAQINQANFSWQNLSIQTAFDPCKNLRAAQAIFNDCYARAMKKFKGEQAMQAAYSCYYSGNFSTGFKANANGKSYVNVIAQNTPQTKRSNDITVTLDRKEGDKLEDNFITIPAQDGAELKINADLEKIEESIDDQEKKPPAEWDVFGDFN